MVKILFLCQFVVLMIVSCASFKDMTPKCSKERGGECVNVDERCPFKTMQVIGSRRSRMLNKLICNREYRRCCVPFPKQAEAKRKHHTCGISQSKKDPFRIHGGWKAMPGEWPWQVSLRSMNAHACGGTLIDQLWVLTAAHCFQYLHEASDWLVVVSDTDTNKDESVEQQFQVKRIILHPKFNDPKMSNDIALLELKKSVQLNEYANIACLPHFNESFDNMPCTVTGYGATEKNEKVSSHLLEVTLPIMENKKCQQKYCKHNEVIYNENICAGFLLGERDACQGDSGGPLVCLKKDLENRQQWILAGVVSYGFECAKEHTPGVYTRVSHYLDWIEHHTGLTVDKKVSKSVNLQRHFTVKEVSSPYARYC